MTRRDEFCIDKYPSIPQHSEQGIEIISQVAIASCVSELPRQKESLSTAVNNIIVKSTSQPSDYSETMSGKVNIPEIIATLGREIEIQRAAVLELESTRAERAPASNKPCIDDNNEMVMSDNIGSESGAQTEPSLDLVSLGQVQPAPLKPNEPAVNKKGKRVLETPLSNDIIADPVIKQKKRAKRSISPCTILRVTTPVLSVTGEPTPRSEWISDSTYEAIQDNMKRVNKLDGECRRCDYKGRMRLIHRHTKQHFIRAFCLCQFTHNDREVVQDHVKQHRSDSQHHRMYLVDAKSYSDFCRAVHWAAPPGFPSCEPVRVGEDQRIRPAPPALPKDSVSDFIKHTRGWSCTEQEPSTSKGPERPHSFEPPMSRRERDDLIREYLGREGPSHQERASLARKVSCLRREGEYLTYQATEIRKCLDFSLDDVGRRIIEKEARGMEDLARKQFDGLRGLRGDF